MKIKEINNPRIEKIALSVTDCRVKNGEIVPAVNHATERFVVKFINVFRCSAEN